MDDVTAAYAEGGFEISDEFRDLPDHVAAELEFLYTLIFREARAHLTSDAKDNEALALRHRFLEQHLNRWIPSLAGAIECSAQTAYFRDLAALTVAFVDRERELA